MQMKSTVEPFFKTRPSTKKQNYNSTNSILKIILFNFCLSGVFLNIKGSKNTFKLRLSRAFNILLSIFSLLIAAGYAINIRDRYTLCYAAMIMLLTINYVFMFLNIDEFGKFWEKISKISIAGESKRVHYIRSWIIIGALAYIPVIVCCALELIATKEADMFLVEINHEVAWKTIQAIFSFFLSAFLIPIMHPFSMLYCTVCSQIVQAFEDMVEDLKKSSIIDYNKMRARYFNLKAIVKEADEEFSVFVFNSVLLNAIYMYNCIIMALDSYSNSWLNWALSLMILIINCVDNLLIMFFASKVNESSSLVWETAQSLPYSHQWLTQQRFISSCEGGVDLTVWKMVPIRRVAFVANMGTTLTYVLLVHGLNSSVPQKEEYAK